MAGEHLLTSVFVLHLYKLLESVGGERPGATRVVVACMPDERHEIGAMATAYCLARRGFEVHYLGPMLPFEDLERMCRTLAPAMVCLSVARATLLQAHKPELRNFLSRWRNRVIVVVGGAGVPETEPELTALGAVPWPAGNSFSDLMADERLQSVAPWPKVKE